MPAVTAFASGESVSLTVRLGWFGLRIATASGTNEVTSAPPLGAVRPLAEGLSGRTILAWPYESVTKVEVHVSRDGAVVDLLLGATSETFTRADRAQAEGQLTQALRGLLAVAEAYPQLQASEQFKNLQQQLSGLEDDIQNSRRYYNAVVRDLNTRIASFPTNILAGMFGFSPKQFFEAPAADRENVQVKFT